MHHAQKPTGAHVYDEFGLVIILSYRYVSDCEVTGNPEN